MDSVESTGGLLGGSAFAAEMPSPFRPATPRLLDRVRIAIRTRHLSPRTEEAYVFKRHPSQMAAPEVTGFLSSLAVEGRVAASTQDQALCALLFLYRHVLGVELPWLDGLVHAKRPVRVPVVLGREEVAAVLGHLHGPKLLAAALLYGSGLRLLESLRLRVKDVDFARSEIVVRAGKGDRDRRTMLPGAVKDALARHVGAVRRLHQRDLAHGAGWVVLPHALGRKYPNAGREWGWQWVFPATRIHVHHLHESVLQRAVREAVLRAGITKPAGCHTFRHSFATCSATAMSARPWCTRTS